MRASVLAVVAIRIWRRSASVPSHARHTCKCLSASIAVSSHMLVLAATPCVGGCHSIAACLPVSWLEQPKFVWAAAGRCRV